MLTKDQRSRLLRIARDSIHAVFHAGIGAQRRIDPALLDPELTRPSGAFVSLHTLVGDLRGCIGSIEPVAPLCEAVASNAVNAAFRDPRFHPVRQDELSGLRLEISVMSPIEVVRSVEEIVVGRDGLIIRHRGRAGLLLPQVATEYAWDRETFLTQTCVKAGLPPASWRAEECRIERFSAEVFSE